MDILKENQILEELKLISQKFDLSLLILFGSRAKGNFKENSDFDFAFFSKNTLDSYTYIDLFNEIMFLLKNENIDLIDISKNHDVKLRNEIFQSGVLIYEKNISLFSDFKFKAWIDYIDFQKFTKNNYNIIKNNIRKLEI